MQVDASCKTVPFIAALERRNDPTGCKSCSNLNDLFRHPVEVGIRQADVRHIVIFVRIEAR